MAGLNTGARPAADHGDADPVVSAALADYAARQGSEQAALAALAGSRLLVPLVERPADAAVAAAAETAGDAAGDAGSAACGHGAAREMAFPTLIGRDGRAALLAFTSLAALASWRADARPVPAEAAAVWGAAVADGCAVIVDVAGPVPIAVDGARLAALAAGQPPPAPEADPDIRADITAALATAHAGGQAAPAGGQAGPAGGQAAETPVIIGAELAAGPDGTDLAVRLLLRPGTPGPPVQRAVQAAAEVIVARLSGRLRRGIEFSAAPAPGPRA